MSRAESERIRLERSLKRQRAHLDAIEIALKLPGPIGLDVAQGLIEGATEIALQIAKHDAYDLVEQDALSTQTKDVKAP